MNVYFKREREREVYMKICRELKRSEMMCARHRTIEWRRKKFKKIKQKQYKKKTSELSDCPLTRVKLAVIVEILN